MTQYRQFETANPVHYSTGTFAWNNVAGGRGASFLSDSEKRADSDGRQPKPALANLKNPANHQGNPATLSKEEAFRLITQARELVQSWEVPSPATMQQYQAATRRLHRNRKWPEEYAQTGNGYFYYRAALVATQLAVLQKRLVTLNRLQKNKDPLWFTACQQLENPLRVLRRYPPDQEHTHLDAKIQSRWNAEDKTPRSTAKRKGLGRLPANWRTLFWRSFPKSSPHRLVLAIMSLTGCRPSELAKGVRIEVDDGENLRMTIRGTKTHNGIYGQEYRQLTIPAEGEEAQALLQATEATAEGNLIIFTKNTKALAEAIRRHSEKLWPRRTYVVSPYSFRHQLAADLKNDHSPAEVAMIMGHSVCRTQQYYGVRNQGKAGRQILRFAAEKDVLRDAGQCTRDKQNNSGMRPERFRCG
ncbi:MAG: site-specific integrase [Thermodesulfobacteriota bacterium]